jgi:uncharacterized repeat protein (TIGR01451 family)
MAKVSVTTHTAVITPISGLLTRIVGVPRGLRVEIGGNNPTKSAVAEKEISMKTKSSQLVRLALAAAFLVVPMAVFGQVTAEMSAFKVVVENRKEVKASAAQARPGDVIEYSVVYRNRDKGAAKNVMATLPIPTGMEFLPKTSSPGQVMASLDGSEFSAVPLTRKVKKADGTVEDQEVPYSEYRFLRWNLGDLPAGGSKEVSARVRITSSSSVTASER